MVAIIWMFARPLYIVLKLLFRGFRFFLSYLQSKTKRFVLMLVHYTLHVIRFRQYTETAKTNMRLYL